MGDRLAGEADKRAEVQRLFSGLLPFIRFIAVGSVYRGRQSIRCDECGLSSGMRPGNMSDFAEFAAKHANCGHAYGPDQRGFCVNPECPCTAKTPEAWAELAVR